MIRGLDRRRLTDAREATRGQQLANARGCGVATKPKGGKEQRKRGSGGRRVIFTQFAWEGQNGHNLLGRGKMVIFTTNFSLECFLQKLSLFHNNLNHDESERSLRLEEIDSMAK
jgi:hypothetical protein